MPRRTRPSSPKGTKIPRRSGGHQRQGGTMFLHGLFLDPSEILAADKHTATEDTSTR